MDFPDDYVERLRTSIAKVNPELGKAIREYEKSLEQAAPDDAEEGT